VLDELAAAGTFFLTFSGGEVLMRRDFFELLEYARHLMFAVRIKTNAVMIGEDEARRMLELGVDQIQVSIYSHRPEVHDAITKLPGSLRRSIHAIRFLSEQGLRVAIANVLMTANLQRGHTLAYISPYGDVFPCVQFPLPSGNVRRQKFLNIWNHSSELNEVRSIRARDLPCAPPAAMSGHAPAAPASPTWRGTCPDRRQPTARNRSIAPESAPRICFVWTVSKTGPAPRVR